MSGTHAAILALTDQGHGVTEIARRLGVAQATVHYHLRRESVDEPEGPAALDSGRPRTAAHVTTRAQVHRLLTQGISRAEIARQLEVSKSTVSYHARRLGNPVDARCARRYDWCAVQAFHDAGHGVRACVREFGFSTQTWHAAVGRGDLVAHSPLLPVEVVFASGTPRDRGHLKKRLLKLGLRVNRCERCGIDAWQGEPLSLTLHHRNGDRDDNRLENLQLLCPNCHSQTDNFAGRRRPHEGRRVRAGESSETSG